MNVSIDKLAPQKHLIDLSDYRGADHVVPESFELSKVFGDIILVAPIDENELGEIQKDGIVLTQAMATSAWRTGLVLLTGQDVQEVEPGDYVIYPNDRGLVVKNLNIKGFEKVKVGSFVNEERLFGVCTPKNNESSN